MYNHEKYKDFCNLTIGRYLHRSVSNNILPRYYEIENIFLKDQAFIACDERLDYFSGEVLLTAEQIEQACFLIKDNINLLEAFDIVRLLKRHFKSELSLSIDEDTLDEGLTVSDVNYEESKDNCIDNLLIKSKDWVSLVNTILETWFPESLLQWVQDKLFITSETAVALFIEYAKFIILKANYYGDLICPFYIDQVWREHFVLTKHYFDFCFEILGWEDGIIEYPHLNLSYEGYKKVYVDTVKLYSSVFGREPDRKVWRDVDCEYEAYSNHLITVNLYSLVDYFQMCEFLDKDRNGLNSNDSLRLSIEEIIKDEALKNIEEEYDREGDLHSFIKNRWERIKSRRDGSLCKHLWRK